MSSTIQSSGAALTANTSRTITEKNVTVDVPSGKANPSAKEAADALLNAYGFKTAEQREFLKQKLGLSTDPLTWLLKSWKHDSHSTRFDPKDRRYETKIELSSALDKSLRSVAKEMRNQSPVNEITGNGLTTNPNEAIAARNGVNQTAQQRADLNQKLNQTSAPAANTTAPLNATNKDVSQMPMQERLTIAIQKAIEHLGPETGEKLKQLLSPENIAIMVGTTAALIAVQGVPFLDVAVDAAILGVAVYSLGSEAIDVVKDLVGFAAGVANAKTEKDLDAAGQQLAHATATVGVDAVAALLLHKAVKSIKTGELPPPNTKVVEMTTPEGFKIRVRVPVEPETTVPPKGGNVVKMEGDGVNSTGKTPPETKAPTVDEAITARRAKLEEMQRQRAEAGAQKKLQEGIREAEAKGKLDKIKDKSVDDYNWLQKDPRHKELAYDPDTKSFKVEEARAALKAEQQGLLKPPIKRAIDETGSSRGGDYVDGDGKFWDVKDAKLDDIDDIAKKINYGEDVLIDGRNVSSAELQKLETAIRAKLLPTAKGEVRFLK